MLEKVNFAYLSPKSLKIPKVFSSLYKNIFRKNKDFCVSIYENNKVSQDSLVDLNIISTKRSLKNILNSDQDLYNFELNNNFQIANDFSVEDGVRYFCNFMPTFYTNDKFISISELRSKFLKYKYVFPELELFNLDFLDRSLYSFVYQCLNRIDFYYSHFQRQELINNGVHYSLRNDKGVLHLDTVKNSISMYGGDFNKFFDMRFYKTFDRKESDLDIYDRIRFGFFRSIDDKSEDLRNVKYTNLHDYITHFEKFGYMPICFKTFAVLYKRALFAEFAKPFLFEMFTYLKSISTPIVLSDEFSNSDEYFTMGAIDRFLIKF